MPRGLEKGEIRNSIVDASKIGTAIFLDWLLGVWWKTPHETFRAILIELSKGLAAAAIVVLVGGWGFSRAALHLQWRRSKTDELGPGLRYSFETTKRSNFFRLNVLLTHNSALGVIAQRLGLFEDLAVDINFEPQELQMTKERGSAGTRIMNQGAHFEISTAQEYLEVELALTQPRAFDDTRVEITYRITRKGRPKWYLWWLIRLDRAVHYVSIEGKQR